MTCYDIAAGEYLLFTEVDWRNNIRDPTYVASCYGPSLVNFTDLTEDYDKMDVLR